MAKEKGSRGVQNRHIYSRASYLYQAAAYLANQQPPDGSQTTNASVSAQSKAMQNMSRHVISSIKSVTLKAQIRQSANIKRTICKFCDTIQIEGQTCSSIVENQSKGGRKPWADVLVIKCKTCERVKRYPVSAPKQKRRTLREQTEEKSPSEGEAEAMSTT